MKFPTVKVDVEGLKNFVSEVFVRLGVAGDDARIIADVLVAADQRGIMSHGVARLGRYVDGIRRGIMIPDAQPEIIRETPTALLVDGNGGMGQVVSFKVMRQVIRRAKDMGIAYAIVRNSNHYGIAGYYAMMALEEDLIGISATNSAPIVVPTFGRDMLFGTNPIAVAVPTGGEMPWVLDMATSVVPRGKLEVYARQGEKIPLGWATDERGIPTDDPARVLDNIKNRRGGGILPLGGAGELLGGHKGFGLGILVDIITGVLSLGSFGRYVYGKPDQPPGVCHFFAAVDPAALVPIDQFKSAMDDLISQIKSTPLAEGAEKIWIHGEKEFWRQKAQSEKVEIEKVVIDRLRKIGEELGVPFQPD